MHHKQSPHAELWPKRARIIELGLRDGALGAALLEAGHERWLGAASAESKRQSIASRHPGLASRLTVAPPRALRQNNACVLILRGRFALGLGHFRSIRHARHLALPVTLSPLLVLAAMLGVWQCVLGRLHWPRLVRFASEHGHEARLLAFSVRRRHADRGARRFIPHELGVQNFLTRLQTTGVKHAVLRWFESLPALAPGEDLDLLVEDAALESVQTLLDEGPGFQAVDLYSVTGLPGADFQGMPYFPPKLAEGLLDRARTHRGLCAVPSADDHFLSLAYHALYHKGTRSGLPSRGARERSHAAVDHDYPAILKSLGSAVGVSVPMTLEDLDAYLESRAWRPPHDMLARLARRNAWVKSVLGQWNDAAEDPGLAVFLLRGAAEARGGARRMAQLLEQHGFYVVQTVPLTGALGESVAAAIRGGNWGRGPWPVSGGVPSAALVAYDFEPIAPSRKHKKQFPFLTNARLLVKSEIRDAFNAGIAKDQHCNVVHSSDNGSEALHYLHAIASDRVAEILATIERLKQDYGTAGDVLANCTKSGRRAKIEVVEQAGRLLVKKTFKPHQVRFCERETQAMRDLSAQVSEVPPLVAAGPCWLTMPYYDDVLGYRRSSGKLLPLGIARQSIDALRRVYESGYALIDASIDNLLVDRREGLKLIDFEFSHRYERRPSWFEQSFDMAGCPDDFSGDVPIHGANSYDRNWRPYVGLSLASLLHDPAWLQHLKRTVYFATHAHQFVPRLARYYAKAAISTVRGAPRMDAGIRLPKGGDGANVNGEQPQRRAA